MNNSLISIVTPVYNASRYIAETLQTVQNQTYSNWELILVDDCSTDDSVEIINTAVRKDPRIKLLRNEKNLGAGLSRNNGVEAAKGRYISFLDADDLWHPEKLQRQLEFMRKTGAAFGCTSYEFADENGKPNGKQTIVPEKATYRDVLTNVTVSTITTMFDMSKLTKNDIRMPDIRIGQDAATWWKILKKADYVYGLQDVLAYYRRTKGTLSANKFRAVKYTWRLYRHIENIHPVKSLFYLVQHSYNAIRRRL